MLSGRVEEFWRPFLIEVKKGLQGRGCEVGKPSPRHTSAWKTCPHRQAWRSGRWGGLLSNEKGPWEEEQIGNQKEEKLGRGRKAHGEQLRMEKQQGKGVVVQ